jgi:hypothetical protein
MKVFDDNYRNDVISSLMEWQRYYIPQIITVMNGASTTANVSMYDTWPHGWTGDTKRTPLLILELIYMSSSSSSSSFNVDTTKYWYGLYGLSILFWIEMITTVTIECIVASVPTAIILYYAIILPQQQRKQQQQQHRLKQTTTISRTSIIPYIVGWCILLPIWIILPSPIITYFGVTNSILRFCLCGIAPTLSIFRILESMYNCTPNHAVQSLYDYLLYFSSPLLLYPKTKSIDTNHTPSSWSKLLYQHFKAFLVGLCLTGLYQSLLLHIHPYNTGPTSTPSHLYSWSSLFDMKLWYESLLYAILLQLYLLTFSSGLAFNTILLTGYETQPFSDQPLLYCTSPSNFWGRRWNILIHTSLKNGVYKPIRSLGGPTTLAVVATFIASGLFHEWLLPSAMPLYPHTHGLALAFFLWQSMLIAIEIMIGQHFVRWFASIIRIIPRPIRTLMVISLGLPVGHWFLDSYLRSEFFHHGQYCFPLFLSIPPIPSNIYNNDVPYLFQFKFYE